MTPEPGQRFTEEGIPIGEDELPPFEPEELEVRPAIDPINKYLVSGNGQTLTVMVPVKNATPDQVLLHAAWLVTMAEPFADRKFEEYIEAVRAT